MPAISENRKSSVLRVPQYIGALMLALSACERQTAPTDDTQAGQEPRVRAQGASDLKYPIGHDTIAYWNSGRYSLVLNRLYDEESASDTKQVLKAVHAFRQEGQKVYFIAEPGHAILDSQTASIRILEDMPELEPMDDEAFKKLESTTPGNIRIDPRTFKVRRD